MTSTTCSYHVRNFEEIRPHEEVVRLKGYLESCDQEMQDLGLTIMGVDLDKLSWLERMGQIRKCLSQLHNNYRPVYQTATTQGKYWQIA